MVWGEILSGRTFHLLRFPEHFRTHYYVQLLPYCGFRTAVPEVPLVEKVSHYNSDGELLKITFTKCNPRFLDFRSSSFWLWFMPSNCSSLIATTLKRSSGGLECTPLCFTFCSPNSTRKLIRNRKIKWWYVLVYFFKLIDTYLLLQSNGTSAKTNGTKPSRVGICFTTQTELYENTNTKAMSNGYTTSDNSNLRNRAFIDRK